MRVRYAFGGAQRRQAIVFLALRVLVILAVASVLLYVVAVTPGVPYHVRELFGSRPTPLQALLFAVMVLLALGPPALLGLLLIREPRPWAWLFPIAILAHAVLVFLVFRYATPIASVQDLVGPSQWPIAAELERLIRFVALFLVVSVSVAGGTALLFAITRSSDPLRFLWWVLYAALFLGVGYWIVVVVAATDNVTVLLRGGANPLSWLALALWMLLMAAVASLAAERFAGVFTGTFAALFGVVLFAPLSYAVLLLATEPRVLGPQSSLSALEFLFSGSRSDYDLRGAQLFGHYLLSYLAVMLLLAFAQYPVWVAYATRRFAHNPLLPRADDPPPDAVPGATADAD
ncbi:MAG: hypothetical protein LJE69_02760 [Thiohalocapsa sp.]|jgi:hypothetical protein|uniref:hypothetical protein n=1 Tax=Thiohalocapsa sp. TaxID=2497641 RepID=UPI0025DFF3D6|nr:hypothetical protein [Thiohalocapsa sp.]MCG6940154.1 hypothetical protein [Thiohalocapsa sp.]